jgi:hypothetical protein
MTRNEARKLIKSNAPSKYSNSIVMLLLRLVDLTYRKDKDNAALEVTTTRASLLRAAAVKRRQLDNILTQLIDDGVLLDVSKGNNVTCRIDFSRIEVLPAFGEVQREEKKAHNADRAEQARNTREINRIEAAYRKALADMAKNGQPLRNLLAKALANHRGPFTEEQQAAIDRMLAGEKIEKEMAEACEQQLRDMRERGRVNP